tara:strand:+ start:1236 stop:1463 length:228 start_codon:yes stop_codon:yes gene_type:complete
MSRGPFYSKFKSNTRELISAVEGKADLEYDYPELYKQIYSYYKGRDVYLYDDKDKDYNIILDELEYDLMNAGVMV